MLRGLLIGLGILGAAAVITVALAQATPQTKTSEEPHAGRGTRDAGRSERFTVNVTLEMRRHSRIRYILYFVATFYSFGVLLLLLSTGWSARMRDLAARVTRRRWAMAMLYMVFFSILTYLLTFPLDLYGGFVVPHQFDLSNQTFPAWLIEGWKALAISVILSAMIVPIALWMIRRLPRRWWLALWIGSIPLTILLIVVAPVIIDPVFNKFEQLKDPVLREKLLALANRAGIEGADVFQVDKSKQTKTMNAYVTGIGPTKRIVLWDTLLAKMNHDEILAVMGHEMGHYVMNHVWKFLAFILTVLLGVFYLGQKFVEYGIRRWGTRWGFASPDDPAALPWLLLVVSLIMFLLTPVIAAYSRHNEHAADIFTLEMTRLNEPTATAFIKLAEDSKVEPDPPKFIELWRYTHPTLADRIDFALAYRPWEQNQPNRRWKGGA